MIGLTDWTLTLFYPISWDKKSANCTNLNVILTFSYFINMYKSNNLKIVMLV